VAASETVQALKQPAYGHERYRLRENRKKDGRVWIDREIFAQKGQTNLYDDAAKDWVTWQGEYVFIERFGPFVDREASKQFMLARTAPEQKSEAQR
jgi:hypothetical protein